MDDRVNCLTPWDVQSRQIFAEDGVWMTLYAGEGGGRGYVMIHEVCHEIDQQENMDERVVFCDPYNFCITVVAAPNLNASSCNSPTHSGPTLLFIKGDRSSSTGHVVCYAIGIDQQVGKSNCGCAENVMPTLCSDSHGTPHAVCYGVDCRNGALDEEKTHTIQAKPQGGFSLNCTPSVCYSIEGHIIDRETAQNGKGWAEGYAHTLNATDRHAVCFPVDSIGHDIRSTQFSRGGCCDTLTACDYKDPIVVAYVANLQCEKEE